ncbi:hypothetical protein KIW84_011819 [Lathyrus oleraceus]|uniref:Uncharacterized protein n=1 Tax=Pisum sativum TaxID=3888 RepID=A0A9D5BFY1_PEA|nr:hypothetical protein KIW84_011819 [Pisum sativum]
MVMIAIGPQESCEFFHDPSMKSSNAGQVRKSLSIKPHSSGYFVSLTVVNSVSNTKDNFSVPVTTAEFSVMKTACSFALPHIMGWDRLTNQKPSETVSFQPNRQLGGSWLSTEDEPTDFRLGMGKQMQIGSHYRNYWDALIGIIRSGGLFSLYAGWKVVLCRNIPQQQIQAKPRPREKSRV